jgi:hypothetical protein
VKRCDVEFVTTVDRTSKQKMRRADAGKNSESSEKKMEGPCLNHDFPIKHLFKDDDLLNRYLKGELMLAPKGKQGEPGKGNKEEDEFPSPEGCVMIFSGPAACKLKRKHKLKARRVNVVISAREAIPTDLKWLEVAITFDRADHPNNIPQPGRFPLIVDPIIGKTRPSRVLLDG